LTRDPIGLIAAKKSAEEHLSSAHEVAEEWGGAYQRANVNVNVSLPQSLFVGIKLHGDVQVGPLPSADLVELKKKKEQEDRVQDERKRSQSEAEERKRQEDKKNSGDGDKKKKPEKPAKISSGVSVVGESGHYSTLSPDVTVSPSNSFWASLTCGELGAGEAWIAYSLGTTYNLSAVYLKHGGNQRGGPQDIVLQRGESKNGPWENTFSFRTTFSHQEQRFDGFQSKGQFFRLLFKTNHGETRAGQCKFIFNYVQFEGVLS